METLSIEKEEGAEGEKGAEEEVEEEESQWVRDLQREIQLKG